MVVRNFWSMVTVVCLAGAVACHKKSNPAASSVPVITSFSPGSGLTASKIELSGSGFDGTITVSVGGSTADWSRHSDSDMTVTVPDGAVTGIIGVVNSLGSGGSQTNFAVIPTLTAISPVSGSPGTSVTLTGTGLVGTQKIVFGSGPAANFYINSANQAQVTVPLGSTSGPITVTSSTGLTAASPAFTYSDGGVKAPVLTSFTPAQGLTGSNVTLAGSGFTGVSSVQIGGANSYFTVTSDTAMTVQVPAAAASGVIQLVSVLGNATSATPFSVTPTITGFAPATGPAGTLVTITGTGFRGATAVNFGNAVASNFLVLDANTVKANVKAGSATGPVSLTSNTLTCVSTGSFTFVPDAVNAPVIASLTPVSAAVGATVTLTGTGFTGVTGVQVGGAAATFTATGDTSIAVVVPANAATGFIAATNALGTNASPTTFTVLPSITGLSATSGKVGDTVTITGTGFIGASTVVFGGGPTANFVVVGANTITTQVPTGATTGVVTLTAFGASCASVATFTVNP
jgi:hypothetical protein